MDHVAIRYPTHVNDVARVIHELTKRVMEPEQQVKVFGRTFHYTGSEPYTKYEMALEMAQLGNLPVEKIVPQSFTGVECTCFHQNIV